MRRWVVWVWVSCGLPWGCDRPASHDAVSDDGCAPPPASIDVGWAGCSGCGVGSLAADPITVESATQEPRGAPKGQAPEERPGALPHAPQKEPQRSIAVARQRVAIRATPSPAAELRGRLGRGRAFSYTEVVDGEGCPGSSWARLAEHAYVCLSETRPAATLDRHEALFYAQMKGPREVPRWRSLGELLNAGLPFDFLQPHHDYAFVSRKTFSGEVVLIDSRGRAVLESDVRRLIPSSFAGRDLLLEPLQAGKTLAWVVSWPHTQSRVGPGEAAAVGTELAYHTQLLVDATQATEKWLAIEGIGEVERRSLRIWQHGRIPRPAGLEAEEVWIDVDLTQQILTMLQGAAPVFVTLISAGLRSPTPTGIFRVRHKLRTDTMASSPGATDAYEVEAVPHVQYFAGGYALHGAYWHNGFGRPLSHGCINLSPHDAERVFDGSRPLVGPGWEEGFETRVELGTVVQVRRGLESPPDRRRERVLEAG